MILALIVREEMVRCHVISFTIAYIYLFFKVTTKLVPLLCILKNKLIIFARLFILALGNGKNLQHLLQK